MMACIIGLCGSTWAWFSATVSNEVAPIEAATYEMTIKVEDATGTSVKANSDGTYDLLANVRYTITLTGGGTATTGFGELVRQGTTLRTAQVATGESLTFLLTPNTNQTITISSRWGIYNGTPDIEDGAKIGSFKKQATPGAAKSEKPAKEGTSEQSAKQNSPTKTDAKKPAAQETESAAQDGSHGNKGAIKPAEPLLGAEKPKAQNETNK